MENTGPEGHEVTVYQNAVCTYGPPLVTFKRLLTPPPSV